MPRVIFLNRYFFPDHSATSQVLSELAFALVSAEQEVHVITSRQSYDDPQTELPVEETVGGVRVHRVRTTHFGRSRLLGRSIDYISFYLSAGRALASIASADDLVIAKTDPPLLSLSVLPVVKRRRAHLINWLQDLYPEVAIASGLPWLRGPIGQALLYMRDLTLKAARANVVVGERMAARLAARGIPKDTIHCIPNFAADDLISPVSHADNPLRKEWGLDDKFVVGYSGNLGRVHEFSTILNAALQLKGDPRIIFLCVGGGTMFDLLRQAVNDRGLQNKFVFRPYQRREVLKYSLCAADVHWISLRPEFEGLVVPSKIYGIAAAARPIIAITEKNGEVAGLIQSHRCGVVIEPGDARALATSLSELMNNPSLRADLGANARAMLQKDMTKAQAVHRWRQLIDEIQL